MMTGAPTAATVTTTVTSPEGFTLTAVYRKAEKRITPRYWALWRHGRHIIDQVTPITSTEAEAREWATANPPSWRENNE